MLKQNFRGMTLASRPRKSPMPDVTPIVNVALVLLIVFMVVMPIIQEGITVDTPNAQNAKEIVEQGAEKHMVLAIKEDGSLFINLHEVARERVKDELALAYSGREGTPIVIKGARNLPYKEILDLMEICQSVGASGVELMAKKVE